MGLDPISSGIGGLLGGIAGVLPTKSGFDAGNMFMNGVSTGDIQNANKAVQNVLNYNGSQDALNGIQGSNTAASQVMSNPLLGQLYGNGGVLSDAIGQEKNLAGRGYSLQPEDYEAYGQAQGNITRQFDNSQNNLSNALASRGLSNSGVANQSFSGSEGNKLEMLGQLQTQIAQQRMQTNLQRLSQAQGFLNQMGQNAENAVQQQYGRQLSGEQQNFGEAQGKAQTGQAWLQNAQAQGNEQLSQRQRTASMTGLAKGLQGALSGAASVGGLGSALGGAFSTTNNYAAPMMANESIAAGAPNSDAWANYMGAPR